MNMALSLIKSSTAERFPKTMLMIRKKKAPLLSPGREIESYLTFTSPYIYDALEQHHKSVMLTDLTHILYSKLKSAIKPFEK